MQGEISTQAGQTGATQTQAELLTVAEAAALLRVKPSLLYRRPDLIPGAVVRIGTSVIRYRAATLRAALGLDSIADTQAAR